MRDADATRGLPGRDSVAERPSVAFIELEPRWIRRGPMLEGEIIGVVFSCPEHACRIDIPFVPYVANGWTRTGDRLEYLTLGPSIRSSCGFHGWVRLGRVTFCPDSK